MFYLGSWPFEMIFTQDDSGKIVSATRVNPTGDWPVTGQEYPKVAEIPETALHTKMIEIWDIRDRNRLNVSFLKKGRLR